MKSYFFKKVSETAIYRFMLVMAVLEKEGCGTKTRKWAAANKKISFEIFSFFTNAGNSKYFRRHNSNTEENKSRDTRLIKSEKHICITNSFSI